MQVDRGRFLLIVSTLAAGGAAGYLASEKGVVPHIPDSAHTQHTQQVQPAPVVVAPEPAHVMEIPATTTLTSAELKARQMKASCDDSVGEPDACPTAGFPTATEEGGCGGFAAMRCADFKKTMKPKVAQNAVACLNKLTAGERCDPKRVELCAHNALMNACDDAEAESVTKSCDAITTVCTGSSKNECTMAMSGLKEIGREAMTDCAKKHCNDKGILGCEAASISQQARAEVR